MSSAFDKFRSLEKKNSAKLIDADRSSTKMIDSNISSTKTIDTGTNLSKIIDTEMKSVNMIDSDMVSTKMIDSEMRSASCSNSSSSSSIQQPPAKKARNLSEKVFEKLDSIKNKETSLQNLPSSTKQQQQQEKLKQKIPSSHQQQQQQQQIQQQQQQQQHQQINQTGAKEKDLSLSQTNNRDLRTKFFGSSTSEETNKNENKVSDQVVNVNKTSKGLEEAVKVNKTSKVLEEATGTKNVVANKTSNQPKPLQKSATTVQKPGKLN
jgi:hypothetical protein